MMRIITGSARGVKLKTLEGDATRPTMEKVKEAVFSTISFDIEGRRVLDLFAGSGQMGLEALSRGAEYGVFVDKSADAQKVIYDNAVKTKLLPLCNIVKSDIRSFLKSHGKDTGFGLVFIDPPYADKVIPEALEGLISGDMLIDRAIIVCETGDDCPVVPDPYSDRLEVLKHVRYGICYITILEYTRKDGQ